jgi:hypothetical protein
MPKEASNSKEATYRRGNNKTAVHAAPNSSNSKCTLIELQLLIDLLAPAGPDPS